MGGQASLPACLQLTSARGCHVCAGAERAPRPAPSGPARTAAEPPSRSLPLSCTTPPGSCLKRRAWGAGGWAQRTASSSTTRACACSTRTCSPRAPAEAVCVKAQQQSKQGADACVSEANTSCMGSAKLGAPCWEQYSSVVHRGGATGAAGAVLTDGREQRLHAQQQRRTERHCALEYAPGGAPHRRQRRAPHLEARCDLQPPSRRGRQVALRVIVRLDDPTAVLVHQLERAPRALPLRSRPWRLASP